MCTLLREARASAEHRNFRELRQGDVRRILLPRTWVNRDYLSPCSAAEFRGPLVLGHLVNKGERKAGDPRGGPRHIMESDFALAYPYAAMSHETIPAITTRIEHWPTSLLNSGRESSSSLSLSSSSTDLIYFSSLCRWDRRVKWCASRFRDCSS
jgi:hypothetical protein